MEPLTKQYSIVLLGRVLSNTPLKSLACETFSDIKSFAPVGVTQQNCSSGVKNNPKRDVFVKSNDISFGSNATIAAKLNSFLPDLYGYILHSEKLSLEGVGEIVQKSSPHTLVKPLSEIPPGSNVHNATSAYFYCKYNFSPDFKQVIPGEKSIYLELPVQDTVKDRIIYMENIVHEMTHIFQEESSDRVSKIEFFKDFLTKDMPPISKYETLAAMPRIFSRTELQMQQPLLFALGKKDIIPVPVSVLSPKVLNNIYLETVNSPVDDFIARTIVSSMTEASQQFPNIDRKTVLQYISQTAQKEQEAHLNAGYMVKRALGINSPVDMEYRVLLYDRFTNVAGKM